MLFGYIAYIAHCVDIHLETIEVHSHNELKAKERCEDSIHEYLDALTPSMAGVQEKKEVDKSYPQPLEASKYP